MFAQAIALGWDGTDSYKSAEGKRRSGCKGRRRGRLRAQMPALSPPRYAAPPVPTRPPPR